MNILIIGANGFLGAHITAGLLEQNYQPVCAVRNMVDARMKFPSLQVVYCDFNADVTAQAWLPRLKDIDVVINVAGVLNSARGNDIQKVHFAGPAALFDACVMANVKRVIHISALGIDDEHTTKYALTKKRADDYLKNTTGVDWVILQPSLVYAEGCYGGTTMLRSLASSPCMVPLIGNGLQKFQPIHMRDLVRAVLFFVQYPSEIKRTFKLVGPDVMSVKDILIGFRRWLGLKPAKFLHMPKILVRMVAKLGDFFSVIPLNSTAYIMLLRDNTADKNEWTQFTGLQPCSFEQGLSTTPLTAQSLWHARLFNLKPLLKWGLGLFWVASGFIALVLAPDETINILTRIGFSDLMAEFTLFLTCSLDVALGIYLMASRSVIKPCALQILTIVVYTSVLNFFDPLLWLEPLGALLKNIPLILATMVLMAIDKER